MQRRVVALAGNPNVGKSTVFNELTGLTQHTGNWPGKTVEVARGLFAHDGVEYEIVDLPGSYSLLAHSAEEEVARDFLCFAGPDAAIVVCDASCLERNINLVLQTLEIQPRTVVCVNLMDEAGKKKIAVDVNRLSALLGVPVCGCAARSRHGLDTLAEAMARVSDLARPAPCPMAVRYPDALEEAVARVEPAIAASLPETLPARWAALHLLMGDASMLRSLRRNLGVDLEEAAQAALEEARASLLEQGIDSLALHDHVVESIFRAAEKISAEVVRTGDAEHSRRQLRADRLLTSRRTGMPVMLLLLALVFWITLAGANVPSRILSDALMRLEDVLTAICRRIGMPAWLHGALVLGAYRVMAWVVAVMLPPMAIFFPLFTLLEDMGYLPRVAFNLDRPFKCCGACGKQALTMCMGFGCNAAGVTGCRIIDSPRERLIAILTNSFVPCNGRFPTLIAILSMFFIGAGASAGAVLPALLLTLVIVLGVLMTLLSSRFLSRTMLRGIPSSFTLELPPYRRPRVGRVIIRSLLDRTLFVLGRAMAVAAPAGLLLWVLANVEAGGMSLLAHMTGFLDPAGRLLGMDGTILTAFILGFPANEIVLPIAMMAYLAEGVVKETPGLMEMKALLVSHGWTYVTAICTLLFSLMHWPCSTTCLTIHKETGSVKWTAMAFLLPTAAGAAVCAAIAAVARMF
ncbi:MAG: ferrous iron transport protein B [Firmicutes bacterium]|nr:ferrous iron transport protein B [Bacillota bacterium]